VDAGEGSGELFFDVFEAAVDEEFVGGGDDADVFFLAFEVEDVFEEDLLEGAAGFDEEILVFGLGGLGLGRGLLSGAGFVVGAEEVGFDLLEGGVEAFEGNGFQQIVDRREAIAFGGEFGIGGGEDDAGRGGQEGGHFDAGEVGHVDVKKNEVDGMGLEEGEGFAGVVAFGEEVPGGILLDEHLEETNGIWFVVDDQTAQSNPGGAGWRMFGTHTIGIFRKA